MAQGTAAHFANRAPLTGSSSPNHFRLGEWKIGRLLTACFAAIVLLMIVGDVIAVLQLDRVETRAWRFYQADQKSLAIMHVYLDVVTFRDTLTGLAHNQDPHEFASRATALRDNFLRDVTHAQGTLSSAPDVSQDPTILIRLETVRAALPSQVDTLLELVKVEDWQAVRFRLAGQVPPLIGLSSSLVADVEQEVAQERARALESVQRTRRQLYLVLPITALLMLLMAAMLGWYATRRISRPLAKLDAAAQALARGEFGYEVELEANDELADLARAFNYAAQQLHKLYDVIKRSEAYLAESNARLEEAQRITHVGYWEWDLVNNRIKWSDETYRIYGMRPQERPLDLATVQEKIHPEDWQRGMESALRDDRFNAECRVFRPNGEVRIAHFQGEVKKDASGQRYYMFGTVQDITDRKLAEDALQRSQFYISEGQRVAHMGSWAFNAAGFEYWSPELFRIHGLEPSAKPPTVEEYLALVHPDDRAFMKQGIAKMLDDHLALDFTKRIVRSNGEIRSVRCVGVPVMQGGTFQSFVGTAMDVTEQERLTEELRRSEKELRDVIDTIPALVWSALPDGSNTYVNKRFMEYTGSSAEQTAGSGWQALVHPDDLERHAGKWMEAVATGKPHESEVRSRRSDGQYRWQLDRGMPLRDEDGNIVKWYGVTTDIEDRKRAEEALQLVSSDLQDSKAKLEDAQRIAHVGYWEWDLTSNRVIWSDETYRIYGLRPQEYPIDIAVVRKMIHPEDLELVFRVAEETVRGGLRTDVDHRIIRPSGELRTVHSQGDVKKDASGKPCQMFGTVQDITDRKLAEAALQQSQFYLAEGQRLAQMGSWAFNPSGSFDYWSQELFKIYGLDPQNGAPTLEQYLATLHPQDRDSMAETIKRMHAEHSGCDVKKRIVLPDGELRYIRCVGIPVVEGEVLKGFLGTAIDITEQELLTRELERRQAHLAEAQRLTHTGSWTINVRTDEHSWSEEIFRIYEFDPKLKPAWSLIRDRVHPDDRASLDQRKKMEFTQTGWTDSEADYRIVLPDGRIKHLHTIAHPVMDASGQIVEVIGTTMDVTERKRVEDSLRRSESHLAEAQKLTRTGSWAWRIPDRKAVEVSEEWYRIYGFDPAEGPPTWEEFLERVHPEDRVEWRGITERAIVEKAGCGQEFRILLPNGKVKWIRTVGQPVFSEAGDLEQFVGSSTDITELKSAEQEREKLRQLEADLAHTNRVSTLGEMAASLAHEIKQPIAAAITSANSCIEWLSHEPPNLDRARAAAARIDKYGNRAAEIIDRIRSLYKKSPSQRELVDVNQVIHEMLTLLKGEADRCSVAIRTELAAKLPKIKADRVQLQQVFMNLVINAIEAMQDQGGELTVRSQLQDSQLLLSVSDTGGGLPTEKVDQIFSAFFTTKPQGSGMGLAISRSIVESHGGRLWATANDGRGTTFHFTLPNQVFETSLSVH
jgi:PAS domain S-box-containing protein